MGSIDGRNFFGFTWGTGRGRNDYMKTPRVDNGIFTRAWAQMTGKQSPKWLSPTGKEASIFNTTPELNAVISTKADMYSNGIYRHQKQNKAGEWEDIPFKDSEVLQLLNKPNALQSKADAMKYDSVCMDVFGCSIRWKRKATLGELPLSITPFPIERMKIVETGKWFMATKPSEIYERFIYSYDDRNEEKFDPNEIIYKKAINLSDLRNGSQPIADLYMPISNIREAYGFRNVILAEHGALGIISGMKKDDQGVLPMPPEDRKKLENQYQKGYGTHDGQSRTIYVDGELKFTPTTYKTKDMMLFEEIDADMNIIIDYYRMNKNIFSKEKNSTFDNVNEGRKATYENAIIPFANQEAEILTAELLPNNPTERIIIDYSHIAVLQENRKENAETEKLKAEAYSTLIASGKSAHEAELVVYGVKA